MPKHSKSNPPEESPFTCQTVQEKADFYDSMQKSKGRYTFAQVAKFLDLGRNTMLQLFRDNDILMSSSSEWNMPYQADIDKGYFKVEPVPAGLVGSSQVYMTPKGLIWIQEKLHKKDLYPKHIKIYQDGEAYEKAMGMALDIALFDEFRDAIETNKMMAVPVTEIVECCGDKWDLGAGFCGRCGRALKFVKEEVEKPDDTLEKTVKQAEDLLPKLTRFLEAVKGLDNLIDPD